MSAPTIYDIAARAGVGIATVSRVINGSQRVSEKTRQAVQRAMEEAGFRPNNAARRLAAGAPNRHRVAALMPLATTPFYFSVCKSLSLVLAGGNTDLMLVDVSSDSEAREHLERLLRERSCEGVILCSMDLPDELQEQFKTFNIPLVALDCETKTIPHIRIDNVEGGRLLSETLSQCGAKQQALVIGKRSGKAFLEREKGFMERCPPGSPVFELPLMDVEGGRTIARTILKNYPHIDAIACAGDLAAIGIVDELRLAGKNVPEDIQVIGFDDQPLVDVMGLSTIRQPMERFGQWAGSAILQLISPQPDISAPEPHVLPLEVIRRSTTQTGP